LARWLQEVEDKIVPLLASTPGLGVILADLPARSIFPFPDFVRGSSRFVTPSDEIVGLIGVRILHARAAPSGLSSLAEMQEEIVTSLRSALGRR
jgi:hypothetical protein